MCGILGAFRSEHRSDQARLVDLGLASMNHRGPDGEGVDTFDTQYGPLTLGHKRLAIIDLSAAGRQPMHSHCGRFVLTFNGEIYNYIEIRQELTSLGYSFATATDSEVLLAAWAYWGESCLPRLDGMFAFAVFDRQHDTLYCVNDPFGIKPIYYAEGPDKFGFASEILPLLEVMNKEKALNIHASTSFLLWGTHDQGEDTFFEGVRRLEPGHIMEYSLREKAIKKITRWWQVDIGANEKISFDEAAEELRSLFLSSVRLQLRSDVPIGFALSGGLDSSAIVCAARHLEPDYPIRTFSYIASSDTLSERRWADIVNDHVGAQAHYIFDSDANFDLDAAIQSQGEPFGGTSLLASWHVFQRMRSEGVVVSLDGQGADECLAGYDGYPAAVIRDYMDRGNYVGAAQFLRAWSKWPGRSGGAMIKALGDMFVPKAMRRSAIRLAGYDPAPKWLSVSELGESDTFFDMPTAISGSGKNKGRRLAERLDVALTAIGLPRLLRYADRNSMFYSIESRVPFLSPGISRFLLTMPTEYLVSDSGQTKRLFRKSMRGIVPDAILDRRDKIGFETPELDLLIKNRTQINRWLEGAEGISFLNTDEVRKTVDVYLSREVPYQSRCWRLINFCRWHSSVGFKL